VVCMAVVELLIEGAPRRVHEFSRAEVGLILTCGEYTGCCLLALLCGGTFFATSDDGLNVHTSRSTRLRFWLPYVWLGFLLFCVTGFANIAVAWVQYPVKVVMKSSKLMPTMIVSAVIGNSRRFSSREYAGAVLICLGTAGFSYHAGRSDAPPEMVVVGVLMLLVAMVSDVVMVNTQQWMMQKRGVPPLALMLRQNFVCLLGSLLVTSTTTDAGLPTRMLQHPHILYFAVAVGLITAVAVWAATHLVHEAGSVVYVGMSTLRKVLTLVLSYIIFPKPFGRLQLAAVIMVFAGLLLPLLPGFAQGPTKGVGVPAKAPHAVVRMSTTTAPHFDDSELVREGEP